MAEPETESDLDRMYRITTGPRKRSKGQCVDITCRLLRERWWSAFWVGGGEVTVRDSKNSSTYFVVTANDPTYGHRNGELSLIANFEDEEFGYSFDHLGFFHTRKLKKACKYCGDHCLRRDQIKDSLEKQLGRSPTNEELCRAVGLPPGTDIKYDSHYPGA